MKREKEVLLAHYHGVQLPYPKEGRLKAFHLKEDSLYSYTTRVESIPLTRFGPLVNYVSPIHVNPDGCILNVLSKHKDMKTECDSGTTYGSVLMSQGVCLAQEWSGVGYDDRVRYEGDFGARLYAIEEQ